MIDLQVHKQDLAQADQHVDQARHLIETQRKVIDGLYAHHQPAHEAETLLAHLEESQAFLILHRLRLAEYVDKRLRLAGMR